MIDSPDCCVSVCLCVFVLVSVARAVLSKRLILALYINLLLTVLIYGKSLRRVWAGIFNRLKSYHSVCDIIKYFV